MERTVIAFYTISVPLTDWDLQMVLTLRTSFALFSILFISSHLSWNHSRFWGKSMDFQNFQVNPRISWRIFWIFLVKSSDFVDFIRSLLILIHQITKSLNLWIYRIDLRYQIFLFNCFIKLASLFYIQSQQLQLIINPVFCFVRPKADAEAEVKAKS